jgi:hypothetical protein
MLLIFFFFLCRTGTGGMTEGEGRRKKTTWHAVWDLEGMDGMRCETQRKEETEAHPSLSLGFLNKCIPGRVG